MSMSGGMRVFMPPTLVTRAFEPWQEKHSLGSFPVSIWVGMMIAEAVPPIGMPTIHGANKSKKTINLIRRFWGMMSSLLIDDPGVLDDHGVSVAHAEILIFVHGAVHGHDAA